MERTEIIALAEKVHALTKKYHVPLIIDDRVDVALAVDAEGVHLGAEDMTIAQARKILGEDKIIGATAKTVPWALDVYGQGADYLGVGAIYPTTTKVKTVLTSTDTLRDICNAVTIPVNAIGGLNKDNIDGIIKDEVGKVFAKVLEHAGVYKRTNEGKKAFLKFIDKVNSL